jgi:hypothetical protein
MEFYKNKSKPDGLQNQCKSCQKTRWLSEKGRDYQRRYSKSDTGRISRQKHLQKESSKFRLQEYRKKYRLTHRKTVKAHDDTNHAITGGRIPRPSTLKCIYCNNMAKEYHHEDYDKPLLVVPVCKECHINIHIKYTSVVS